MIEIKKEDVKKYLYFISALTQNLDGNPMQGALSSKADYMGGIMDRFINIVPENIIFDKIIFPSLNCGQKIEAITDFYFYDPKSKYAGIAPDLIGIKVNDKIIPFVKYDNNWKPLEEMPQIEVKTFKEKDYMVSLRNQNYDNKYLVMASFNLRVDYLIPFMNPSIYNEEILNNMTMIDNSFIINNDKNYLKSIKKIDNTFDTIGTLELLQVCNAKHFMEVSTLCEEGTSVEWLKRIEKVKYRKTKNDVNSKFNLFVNEVRPNVYRFVDNKKKWYDGILDGKPFKKNKNNKLILRTLDFVCSDISQIVLKRRNKDSIIIYVKKNVIFNEYNLEKDSYYKITYAILERSEKNGQSEYFMQKSIINSLDSSMDKLKEKLREIINKNVG